MNVVLPKPGIYIVAVSGGVDSVALLDILRQQPYLKLIVAHLDHGIRLDSSEDRELVQDRAAGLGLPFVYNEANLGSSSSEAVARQARYKFLRQAQKDYKAQAIITAHHQDDVLETAIINLLRGSGRKGLTSLSSRPDIIRPLLNVTKQDLINYAKNQRLRWRDDPTNKDETYLRNYVRHQLLARFSDLDKVKLVTIVTSLTGVNQDIDRLLADQLNIHLADGCLDRQWFNSLPHNVAREVMATWLRANDMRDFDSRALERLVVVAKTAQPGKQIEAIHGVKMIVKNDNLALARPER